MHDREQDRKRPWTRILWIVLGILVGITLIGTLIVQTLRPGAMIVPG